VSRTILYLFAALACAQAQQSATLNGRVEDPSGGAVATAVVRLTAATTDAVRQTVADPQGRFRFDALPPGSYELCLTHPGFAMVGRTLSLSVGQAIDVTIRLTVADAATAIDVQAASPVVEAARTQVAGTVLPHEIDALPLNGRNYLDLALLVPGVSRTNTGSSQLFAETSAVPGTGISVAGQRNLNNTFLLDGMSANDDAAGLAGTFFSQEVIREFQVVTSGGVAEFGRASAGVVNIITQSGGNDWHGRVYSFARNQRFDARNALASHKDPLTQEQYGASLDGPLRRDRIFFFSNFEQLRQRAETQVTIAPANAAVLGIPTGGAPTTLDSTNYFARADAHFGGHQLAARYSFYDVSSLNARSVGGLNAISRGAALADRDQSIALSDQAALSPHSLNELRLQFTRSRLSAPVNDPAGPAVNISGVASFGTSTSSPTGRALDSYELSESVAAVRGYHSFKAGIDYLDDRTSIAFPGAVQGVYTFSSLAKYRSGTYATFQQAFGPAIQGVPNANAGGFVQDEWRPVPAFTLNLGLRYDFSELPDPVQPQTRNFAPRLGIAFSPGDHKFVIRAGAGLYYGRIPLRAVSNALQRDGRNYRTAVLSFGQPGAPLFPKVLPAFPDGVLVSISTIDPRIHPDYSAQADLQIDRELRPGSLLSVGYQHLRGIHILLQRNLNVGRPNPNYGNISQYESAGDSYYNGLNVAFSQKASRRISFRASYTLSKCIDDAGTFFFSAPQNNFDLRDDRGLSDSDQRHRVSASGTLDPGRGWQLSSIFTYASALPFNIQTGNDRNGDTTVNDRPVGIGRNTGRAFDSLSLDARISRRFRFEKVNLDALLEGFNLTNRANWQFPNNIFGTGPLPLPAFGHPTAAAAPRQLQLALRLSF
jgi:hypothetical protein